MISAFRSGIPIRCIEIAIILRALIGEENEPMRILRI